MPTSGPPFDSSRSTMPVERQIAVVAERWPSVAAHFAGYPGGFNPAEDLNAVNALEKFLSDDQLREHHGLLAAYSGAYYLAAYASAQLRLEMFLRVMKLWEEA